MQICLYALDPVLATCWRAAKAETNADILVFEGNILNGEADAIVSPANSFGFMDGGIDAAYTAFFGPRVQDAVQQAIRQRPLRELLVGEAIAVSTGNDRYPYCIAAPTTMRRPRVLASAEPVYLATRAAISLAASMDLTSVALPGMGAGTGRLPPGMAARAMLDGIHDALNPPVFPRSLAEVPPF